MFAKFRWTPEGVALALVAIAVSTYFAVTEAHEIVRLYPHVWAWSELMISYAGGFIRRGLIGELAYHIHPFIDARIFLMWSMIVLYSLVYAAIILVACANLNLGSLLFLVSPASLLFTVNDLGAFARKDIVLLAAFVLSLAAVRFIPSRTLALVAVLSLYVVAALTHETALAYFPLALAFLLHTRGSRIWSRAAVIVSGVFVVCLAALIYIYRGSPERIALMISRWQERLPSAFEPPYAIPYLQRGVGGNFMAVVNDALFAPTIAGYAIAAILLLIPIAAYTAFRPPQLRREPLPMLVFVGALMALATPGVLASDWGRYLYMAGLHVFLFLACIASPKDVEPAPRLSLRTPTDMAMLSLWAMLIVCYAGMWRILHWAHQVSALRGGFLFDLVDKIGSST